MNKEQTQITWDSFIEDKYIIDDTQPKRHPKQYYHDELVEQYAQAKVLEVLEREGFEIWKRSRNTYYPLRNDETTFKKHYETEVKPKYLIMKDENGQELTYWGGKKEQTPITAEEFLKDDEFVNVKGFIKESGTLKTTTSLMEQYAKAKVLEALEIIVDKLNELEEDARQKQSEEESYNLQNSLLEKQWMFFNYYIETEVKPKYT